jgi:hypothetical protein
MPVVQDVAGAGSLAALAAALGSFLRRCAARAFAPPDPGAHLLQGALHGMLDAVREFTVRRAAAPQVLICQWGSGCACCGMLAFFLMTTQFRQAWVAGSRYAVLAVGLNTSLACI